jgi:serine/threonine-protein phosphatase 2A regulatory subunit B''
VDCNTVHFGYAIPVSVVPLPEEPELAELVLDPSPDLTPEAVSYLLRHHPQLRQENNDSQGSHDLNGGNANIKMAATAKHENLRNRNGGKFPAEPEEDIAAIAKQISDHAEAIYQTWKSRGLAPAEILTCHSNVTAADKFGSALTPQSSQTSPHQPKLSPIKSALQAKSSPVKTPSKSYTTKTSQQTSPVTVELLASAPSLDANNLEQLVNNFVVEDKARLAAARQQKSAPSKLLPSSIQFALQKFEKQIPSDVQSVSKSPPSSSPFVKPAAPHVELKPQASQKKSSTIGTYVSHVSRSPAASALSSKSQQLTPSIKSSTPVHRHSSVQMSTIETKLPQDLQQQTKRSTTETTSETVTISPVPSSSGLTTWPLKNKSVTVSGGNDRRSTGVTGSDVSNNRRAHAASSNEKYATLPSSTAGSSTKDAVAYLDEVAREEERLINALKTGIVIAEDPTGTTTAGNAISEKKTGGLLQKKSSTKDNKVTSVAKKVKKQQATDIVTQTFPVTATGAQTRQSPEASSTASTVHSPSLAQSFISSPVSKLSSPTDPEAPKSQTTQPAGKDELDKSSLSSLSVVDYAKVRYRAAQQNPLTQQRLEDVKQFEQQRSITGITSVSGGTSVDSKHLHRNEVIPVARNRFQVSPRSTGTESSSAENWRPDWLPGSRVGTDDEAPLAKRRIGSSTANLARPVRHPHADSHPPHQENAIQQRPRITGTASGTNPVRPFLTRGSVAERVLIFEKCPSELLLEKRSRGAPAITTWRSGHDVHTKAQVRNVSDYMHASRICLDFLSTHMRFV